MHNCCVFEKGHAEVQCNFFLFWSTNVSNSFTPRLSPRWCAFRVIYPGLTCHGDPDWIVANERTPKLGEDALFLDLARA